MAGDEGGSSRRVTGFDVVKPRPAATTTVAHLLLQRFSPSVRKYYLSVDYGMPSRDDSLTVAGGSRVA